jgi:hypothetical protein
MPPAILVVLTYHEYGLFPRHLQGASVIHSELAGVSAAMCSNLGELYRLRPPMNSRSSLQIVEVPRVLAQRAAALTPSKVSPFPTSLALSDSKHGQIMIVQVRYAMGWFSALR